MFIIDKIFNLKIDTKNKNITTVTGLKQFDNNSVLNITLLQNSLAVDLSDCTVRINFLREDERVLLYMADIVSAKEGNVAIKLSPEVLEKVGTIQADISVFDSNLLKITSATFNIKVEKSVYNDDTYFTDKDLDLMQQEYIREKERQKAESARGENELARITYEQQRKNNENTRISNEEARQKAETARVAEWNNVKKDANNIKNTLDTTIDTANKTKDNLQNTITAGDKLKQELNVNNYVTNTRYSEFEKKTNSQYKDTTNKLNNFGGRNYLLNSSLSSLTHWSKRFQTNEKNEKNKIEIKDNSCHIINTNQDLIGIYQNPADLDLNENYVLSFYVKCKKDSQMLVGFSDTGVSCLITHSEWKRKSVNIGKPSGQSVGCILYAKQGHEVYIKDVKLERGFVDTDWTLAPEEIIANSKRLDAIEKILIDKGYMTVTQKL
ncbi:phage pre-neck appendage-like protein (plasmid) [Clostridium botulinum C/D str. BKT12695]|nr:phage pre-neck appendage-like protein [Clostridium botulinum C/D str. BKT12695]